MGSADGYVSLPLAAAGHIVDGIDLNPRAVEEANKRAAEYGVADRARYRVGALDDVEGKYDVALAFEIIEHLVDPAAFLDQLDERARKVAITTPYLAWDGGRRTDWNVVEPKEHIRIFDLLDMEGLLTGRGRIFDLYRQPANDGQHAWIFASYRPRQTYSGTVTFLAPGTIEAWSPPKLAREGLGGSETALIRLAEELFLEAGLMCTVYGRIDSPGYYNGVRYRPLEGFRPSVGTDVLVAWRFPEAADMALGAKRLFLWAHDNSFDDRLTPVRAARFEKIIVLSQWHKQRFLELYPFLSPDQLVVIGNGVDRARFAPVSDGPRPKREPHRVAYTSSPDRGLDVILQYIWPKVLEQVPDAELHVYYGWNNFDALAATHPHLAAFKQRVGALLLDSTNVVQHGRVGPDVLAQELLKASVWLYPSQTFVNTPFEETYCADGDTPIDMPRDYTKYPLGVPLREVKAGDLIWTLNEQTDLFELKSVAWAGMTKKDAEVVRVAWDDGTSLICTPDHPILAYDRDWVPASELVAGESVRALRKHMQVQISTGDGRRGKSWPLEHRVIAEHLFGELPQGYHVDHIDGNSWNNEPSNLQVLSPAAHASKSFTGLKVSKLAKERMRTGRAAWRAKVGPEYIRPLRSKAGSALWASMNEEQRAAFIERRRQTRWNHKVVSVEPWGRRDVFNLHVEGNHNFIAGGVVVHNCISAVEAQLAGVVPVAPRYAALAETIASGPVMSGIVGSSDDVAEQYAQAVIGLLQGGATRLRRKVRDHAPAQEWTEVAHRWLEILSHPE